MADRIVSETKDQPGRALAEQSDDALANMARMAALDTIVWPPPRNTWRDDVIDSYLAYQESGLGPMIRDFDTATILRYFDLVELEARIIDELMMDQLVHENITGGRAANPLIAALSRVLTTSMNLAKHIGATPLARLKLGMTQMDGQLALLALEKRLAGTAEGQQIIATLHETDDDVVDAEVVKEW